MNERKQFQQQKKGSLLWLWILFAVVGGIVLIVVGFYILVVGAFFIADRARPSVGDAEHATGQYYNAIQKHDYTTAYNYLERNAIITIHGHPVVMNAVNTLTTASQALDTQDGVISSSTATDGNFEQGKNIVDLTMKVTRNGQSSDVHIKIELVGNDWKILSADGI
jgi:hypothetical protein